MSNTVYLVISPQGNAINRVLWDGKTPFDPGDGLTLLLDDARDLWRESIPPVVIPQTVTLFQLRSAMLEGNLYSVFNSSTMAPTVAQAWQFAGDVSRTGTLATAISSACELSSQQMDDLFLSAATITA